MPVIRVHRQSNFTTINNSIIDDDNASLKARGLLLTMLRLPPNWDYSVAGLVAICKENETAIKSTLKELEALCYLKIDKVRGKNGRFEYIYNIFETPQKLLKYSRTQEAPDPCFPGVEVPGVEVPEVENHPLKQIRKNKDEINKNEINNSLSNEKENFIEKFKALFGRVPDKSLLRIVGQAVPEDIETALSIAAKKKLDNPAAYITAVLTKMQQKRQDDGTTSTDVQAPLEDWEKRWIAEVKKRIAEREKAERENI